MARHIKVRVLAGEPEAAGLTAAKSNGASGEGFGQFVATCGGVGGNGTPAISVCAKSLPSNSSGRPRLFARA